MTEDWHAQLAVARTTATPAQDVWDAEWQRFFDRLLGRGVAPNAAIKRADALMDLNNHGPRPQREEASR